MTTATTAVAAETRRIARSPLRPVRDALAVAGRNLIAYRRVPQLVVFSTIQPVIFVVLFRYVFGGAVRSIPGVPYVDFLIPGVFVQTTVFGAIGSAVGLATDMKSGLLERFRSLPMARSAVLAGRTLADLARNVFVTALMAVVMLHLGRGRPCGRAGRRRQRSRPRRGGRSGRGTRRPCWGRARPAWPARGPGRPAAAARR